MADAGVGLDSLRNLVQVSGSGSRGVHMHNFDHFGVYLSAICHGFLAAKYLSERHSCSGMEAASLETIHQDLQALQVLQKELRDEVLLIKHLLDEDYELSDEAVRQLEDARNTPRAAYVPQEEIEREFLQ